MQKSFQPVTARSPRRIRDLHNAGDEEALVASAQDRSPEAERLPSGPLILDPRAAEALAVSRNEPGVAWIVRLTPLVRLGGRWIS